MGSSCIFPCKDIRKTAEYYKSKLEFDTVEYLQSEQPHICIYKDNIEIILTQANCNEIKPNRLLYGYGYDGGLLLSATIEVTQLIFRLGLFEWDDMIHNTLGCVLGTFIIEKLINKKAAKNQ